MTIEELSDHLNHKYIWGGWAMTPRDLASLLVQLEIKPSKQMSGQFAKDMDTLIERGQYE